MKASTRFSQCLARCGLLLAIATATVSHGQSTVHRVVVGSCLKQAQPQPVWETIAQRRPDLMILTGDNVYADTKELFDQYGRPGTQRHQAAYQTLANNPGFAKLRKTVPILATWDDHDYGLNDAGTEYADKDAAMKVFWDFWGEPAASPRREQPGVYAAHHFGPEGQRLQVLLLDTRYARSPLHRVQRNGRKATLPSPDPDQRVLHDDQWQWLEEQLMQPADVRLIATSIQFLADEHHSEKWANFPLEQARFHALLAKTGANGVVLLSGDRHQAEMMCSTRNNGAGYPVYELTASGLNKPATGHKVEANRYRIGPLYTRPHFGVVDLNWKARRIDLRIVDADGTNIFTQKIQIDDLSASP